MHNAPVEPEELPEAEDLWWSWVVLAALHRAVGNTACRFRSRDLVLELDGADGSWLRMQRTLGSRIVLWGRSAVAPPSALDARRGAPDWALTDATLEAWPTFMAWHVHGEWDTSAPGEDEGALHLLRPILTMDPRVVELGRRGQLTSDQLSAYAHGEQLEAAAELVQQAAAPAPTGPRGSVRTRLRDQIHEQMRDCEETDRVLLQRPPALVHWARVNGPGVPFAHTVKARRDELVPAPGNTRLPQATARSLHNVLTELHRTEASEESGAWLFARVSSDGVALRFDRAFDSWPPWFRVTYAEQGPSLADLAWEMAQRTPRWLPAWATLLPRVDPT